jgi:hypothetical protein
MQDVWHVLSCLPVRLKYRQCGQPTSCGLLLAIAWAPAIDRLDGEGPLGR